MKAKNSMKAGMGRPMGSNQKGKAMKSPVVPHLDQAPNFPGAMPRSNDMLAKKSKAGVNKGTMQGGHPKMKKG
jgi:hypothetical protein